MEILDKGIVKLLQEKIDDMNHKDNSDITCEEGKRHEIKKWLKYFQIVASSTEEERFWYLVDNADAQTEFMLSVILYGCVVDAYDFGGNLLAWMKHSNRRRKQLGLDVESVAALMSGGS